MQYFGNKKELATLSSCQPFSDIVRLFFFEVSWSNKDGVDIRCSEQNSLSHRNLLLTYMSRQAILNVE